MIENKNIFNEGELSGPKKTVASLAETMINNGLADFNSLVIAMKIEDKIYITQKNNNVKNKLFLYPDEIIISDLNENIVKGDRIVLSGKNKLNIGIFKRFQDYGCILHGNPFYSMLVFSSKIGIEDTADSSKKANLKTAFKISENISGFSEDENKLIYKIFEEIKKRNEAPAIYIPAYGVIVAGKDVNEAFSLFNSIEFNSKFILYQNLLRSSNTVNNVFSKISMGIDNNNSNDLDNISNTVDKNNFSDISNEKIKIQNIPEPETINFKSEPEQKTKLEDLSENIDIVEKENEKTQSRPVTVEEKAFRVGREAKIFTAEDLEAIVKNENIKKIIITEGVKVTDFAEIRADALGVELIKE
jgi:ribulose-5-phosphate 4-epimerase/fuculose-1-phosphate aldolase